MLAHVVALGSILLAYGGGLELTEAAAAGDPVVRDLTELSSETDGDRVERAEVSSRIDDPAAAQVIGASSTTVTTTEPTRDDIAEEAGSAWWLLIVMGAFAAAMIVVAVAFFRSRTSGPNGDNG